MTQYGVSSCKPPVSDYLGLTFWVGDFGRSDCILSRTVQCGTVLTSAWSDMTADLSMT